MKSGIIFALFGMLLVSTNCWSQLSIELSPSGISPSSYNVYTQVAGSKLTDPVVNYTSQVVKYTWPFLGNNIVGSIYATVTGLTPGLKMTVQATGSSGFWDAYGVSTGTKTLSTTPSELIYGIWSANNRTRGLTQNITIENFALLKAGNKTITVTYTIY